MHHKKGKIVKPTRSTLYIRQRDRKGVEPLRSRRGQRDTNSSSFSSPDPDYSLGLGQVLVGEEGVFRSTRSRVAIPYYYEQPSSSTGVISPETLKSLFEWSDDEGEASLFSNCQLGTNGQSISAYGQ